MATDFSINLVDVSAAGNTCLICALLLRSAKGHYDNNELNVYIVRKNSWLQIGSEGPRILLLCSNEECLSDSGQDIQIGFPASREAESSARFALLRAWLRLCDESHECNTHNAKSKAALPSRLLCVGNSDPDVLHLHCPKKNDRVEYVALSHCWGEDSPTKNRPQFCTTDNNIQARLGAFSFSELPKTFQDAVQVTRELGIQYLWIDSLCIIQWNKKDWKHEAKRMESVYASAYCTIAATSAVNSNAGFLKRNANSEYAYAQDASGRRFFVCTNIDNFENDVGDAQLNMRAWVMQERVLSRRTIHFSANQTYWECGEGVYCENLTKLETGYQNKYFMLDPNFPNRLLESGPRRTIEFIHSLSEEYSKRGLTSKTDRCVAISGLEARIARVIGCQSRYGIFEKYLHRNLLWQGSEGKMKRNEYERPMAPSWSWMAYDGGIQFMHVPFHCMHWNDNLRFNSWIDKLRFNQYKYALVTDVCIFQNCGLEQRDTSCAILDSSKAERGQIQYDVEASDDLHAERCVVVGMEFDENNHELPIRNYYILVIRQTSVDGEYRRVGAGWVQNDYVVRQKRNVLVV